MKIYDVIVIGAGAAGLMASIEAGKKGLKVILLDHSANIGEKIRISGGGRCNFTNLGASPKNYLSDNPNFCISALKQYNQHDFIKLIESYKIPYHEKTLGQLFCNNSSSDIINMLISECKKYNVEIKLQTIISDVQKSDDFIIITNNGNLSSKSLIIATGGLSIPKIGATDFGYRIAKKFGHNIIDTRPALVPLIVKDQKFRNLSGISINSITSFEKTNFKENILFTHKGLSGPAILQISSYIKDFSNAGITINLAPSLDLSNILSNPDNSKMNVKNVLKGYFPNRFIDFLTLEDKKIAEIKAIYLKELASQLHQFKVEIEDSEGYIKAEVTAGGVDTNELSSKTMESKKVPNLYFIGEVVDVTGWLGGYNFQWAWSSGFVAGNNIYS